MARILPRFDFRVAIASGSDTGKVRAKNEDALLLAPESALFGVADGMGGLTAGEVASRLSVEAAKEHLASKKAQRALEGYAKSPTLENRREVFTALREACERAHARLLEEQEHKRGMMGSTLDLCLLVRDKAFLAHVGDGRMFLVRPRATLQLTEDHLARDPASLRGGASNKKAPRPLVSGIGLASALRIDVCAVDVRKGDVLVLATDGAYGPFEDEAAINAACRASAPQAIVDQIVRHALAKGGRDNATVVALRIDERLVARPDVKGAKGGADATDNDDMVTIQHCPLFVGLSAPNVLAALSSGIEIELDAGKELPRFEAGDLCAYVVLSGVVKAGTTSLGPPALLYGESLVGVERSGATAVVTDRVRCLRIRRDDFREVAEHDTVLGLSLYQRLAGHLARTQ